jgi:FHS family L-fucose permease-like MFS transporter
VLGAAFILAAVFFKLSSVPDRIENNSDSGGSSIAQTIKYPQLWMGMIAIFLYVGVEVATASNLPEFMKQKLNTPQEEIAPFVSLFWASLMIGRWTSAAGAFNISESAKTRLSLLLPFVAFSIFALVNFIAGHDITQFYPYLFLVILLSAADAITGGHPVKQLLTYSILGILALIVGIFSNGIISVYSFIAVGLFCSTLWPCIFTLGITGLGEKTNTGSSLLVMMIMGGGFISVLQGYLADHHLGIQHSYWVGVGCFAYLAFYAYRVGKLLEKQNISLENVSGGGH